MTYKYKITVIAVAVQDWQELRKAIFGEAQPSFEEFGGGIPFTVEFAEPVTPADLGPLVKVELLSE